MLNIAVCDDDGCMLSRLEEIAGKFFRTHCVDVKIRPYQSGENLLYDLQDGFSYDLFLLDIEMPGMSGIDFLKQLLPVHPIPVILVSSLNLRVFDALEAGAVDFVRKPDEANRLSKEIFLSTLRSKLVVAAASHVHLPSAPADPQAGGIRKVSSLPPA